MDDDDDDGSAGIGLQGFMLKGQAVSAMPCDDHFCKGGRAILFVRFQIQGHCRRCTLFVLSCSVWSLAEKAVVATPQQHSYSTEPSWVAKSTRFVGYTVHDSR